MEIRLSGTKPPHVRRLIFDILDVLGQVGLPLNGTDRRLERMAMVCLAVGGVTGSFEDVKSSDDDFFLTTREIINFINHNFGESISPGSYDDIRRKDLALPVATGIVINSSSIGSQATNNQTRGYAINPLFAYLLAGYGSADWDMRLAEYRKKCALFSDDLKSRREMGKVPVKMSASKELSLSYGEHNMLQKAIVEDFLPRYGMGAELLYLGDTSDKFLYRDKKTLGELKFFALGHEELPDIIAYSRQKNLLFLIEAVHSAGPMSELRVEKLTRQLHDCTATIVFITAFASRKDFRRWVADIAWETEVWIADSPDHMIHFNGYKFLEIHR